MSVSANVRLVEGKVRAAELAEMRAPPTDLTLPAPKIRLYLMGGSGTGKTHFLLTRPRLFIFNCDSSPATGEMAEGTVLWPAPGTPITWPAMAERLAGLVKDARAGRSKFDGIAFDSYNGLLTMLHTFAAWDRWSSYWRRPRDSNKTASEPPTKLEDFSPMQVGEQDGRKTWPDAYNMLNWSVNLAYQAGLGVVLSVHTRVVEKERESGPPLQVVEPALTSNQYDYLRPHPDAIVYLTGVRVEENTRVPITVTTKDGRVITSIEERVASSFRQRILTEHPDLNLYLKSRTLRFLPGSIDVSTEGWAGFARAFDASLSLPAKE